MSIRTGFLIILILAFSAACGGGDDGGKPDAKPQPKAEKPVEPMDHAKPPEEPVKVETAKPNADGEIVFEVGDLIEYKIKRFEVAAGSKVKLVLKHTGVLPKEAMGHNIVVLKQGNDMMAFATAAITERDTGFIPPAMKDQVLANSSLVGGGETTVLEFVAPAAGEYDYVCTFPGHAGVMNGKMIVTGG